jgi:hypothetical protein
MRNPAILLVLLVGVLGFTIHISLSKIEIRMPSISKASATASKYFDYRGLTHVHSTLSTGSGTPQEIIEIALGQNMDFLSLMEVNPLERSTHIEGYHEKLLVMTGGEYTYFDSRLLYYNPPPDQPPEKLGQRQIYFADLMSATEPQPDPGFLVLAHPLMKHSRWNGEYPRGLSGIEIVNFKKVLQDTWEKSKVRTVLAFLFYPLHPKLTLTLLFGPPEAELQLWDRLSAEQKIHGWLGQDATAKAVLFGDFAIPFPSYENLFEMGTNHILLNSELTGNANTDRARVLTALNSGAFYFALDSIGSPKGFFAEINQGKKSFPVGSALDFKPGQRLSVSLPDGMTAPFEIIIYKGGQSLMVSNSTFTEMDLHEPGVYRVVVRALVPFPLPIGNRWVPWIYTNPFWVKTSGTHSVSK